MNKEQAIKAQGPDYKPRTRHLDENGQPIYTNDLIFEQSPYLIQHAHNPVNWHAWKKETFEKASAEGKPVFLSIGYSTCHWCHVMEHESFDDTEVAGLLNREFIAIKVDREQRPDVDKTFMEAVMALQGQGGWPLSAFLLPDGRPFFGGTYYPKLQFMALLTRISEVWKNQQTQIETQAGQLAEIIKGRLEANVAGELPENIYRQARIDILSSHDDISGGFGQAPKFPHEPMLQFIVEQCWQATDKNLCKALHLTLDAMARGGIYDQAGGGFHRYATDNEWLIPHFEKMLYNQAQLLRVYAHAWSQAQDPLYARIIQQTEQYLLSEMTSRENFFYSASDADSEGEEGRFFVWHYEDLKTSFPDDIKKLQALYGVSPKGNFEGNNILHLPNPLAVLAKEQDSSIDDILKQLDALNQKLLSVRAKRVAPATDHKIIAAWNGMMISSLAQTAMLTGSSQALEMAEKAGLAIWQSHFDGEKLNRVWLNGKRSVPALSEDYLHLAEAYIDLYLATWQADWLAKSRQLADLALEHYYDGETGGFYTSLARSDTPQLSRQKESRDGAEDSANAVAVRMLNKLWRATGEELYLNKAKETVAAFAGMISRQASLYSGILAARNQLETGPFLPSAMAGGGRIMLKAGPDTDGYVDVSLATPQGWYLSPSSDTNRQTALIATDNSGQALAISNESSKGFRLSWNENSEKSLIKIRLQACSDDLCLPPEWLVLAIPVKVQ